MRQHSDVRNDRKPEHRHELGYRPVRGLKTKARVPKHVRATQSARGAPDTVAHRARRKRVKEKRPQWVECGLMLDGARRVRIGAQTVMKGVPLAAFPNIYILDRGVIVGASSLTASELRTI